MITVNMLIDLNSMIQEKAPFLKIEADRHDMTGEEWTYYKIRLKQTRYIHAENHPLNLTKELMDDIEEFLSNKGIKKLNWNNDLTTFWESR